MELTSEDDWFAPFKLLSENMDDIENMDYYGVPKEIIETSIDKYGETKDEEIERLKSTVEYLRQEIEDKDLHIISIQNLKNFSSFNSATNRSSATEGSISENTKNVRNVENSSLLTTSCNITQEDNCFRLELSAIDIPNDGVSDDDQLGDESVSTDIISELMGFTDTNAHNTLDTTIYSKLSSGSNFVSINSIQTYEKQIADYRYTNHWNFLEQKREDMNNAWNVDINKLQNESNRIKDAMKDIEARIPVEQNVHKWPKDTILIASDSMFNGLDEGRLRNNGKNVKLRCFRGSTVLDMYHYLYPLLQKCPTYLILHVGTNDCVVRTSSQVRDDILALKRHIENKVPGIKVILSQPVIRCDDNALACLRVNSLINKLDEINVPMIINRNIVRKHIGRKGLHLNGHGTAKCAMNIISLIKRL